MSMACGMLALNCESYLALKLALDSRVQALVMVSRVQASASALRSWFGLILGLEVLVWPHPWPLDFGLDYNTAMNNSVSLNAAPALPSGRPSEHYIFAFGLGLLLVYRCKYSHVQYSGASMAGAASRDTRISSH